MNKKIIIVLIMAIVILIVIAVILIALIGSKKQDDSITEEVQIEAENGDKFSDFYANVENEEIELQAYFDIQTCVNNYLNIINNNNSNYYGIDSNENKIRTISENDMAGIIYGVLSEKYISRNNITKENLLNKIDILNKEAKFVLTEAKTIQGDDISSFLVHGILVDFYDYTFIDEAFYIVNIDIVNNIFSIEPIYGNYKSINEINVLESENNIEDNIDNRYNPISVTYITEAQDYIDRYKMLSIGSPEIMYNLFPTEYREKRFGSLDNFVKYVQKNKGEIKQITATSYLANNYSNYYEHVIKDQYDNLYVINEKAKLNYTVTLDTYTIDTEKFTIAYNKATNKEKVIMNIDKFFQMINANDYRTAYSVLNPTFKSTNFPTEESFEQYMKQNIYTHANVKYASFSDEISGVFTYYIELSNKANANDKDIGMNIVMQLQGSTNYTISFEVIK